MVEEDTPQGTAPADDQHADGNCVALIGALLVILTMVVCYMVLTVFSTDASDSFLVRTVYRPSCSNSWLLNRSEGCSGVTRGQMPSIDDVYHATTACRYPLIGNAPPPGPCCRV